MAEDLETDPENLEAAAEMLDELCAGTFYARQAEAERWLRDQRGDDMTRRIVEGRSNGYTIERAPRREC